MLMNSPAELSSNRSSYLTFVTRTSFSFNRSGASSEQSSIDDGPGSLSARYIYALGKLTLDGYEQIVILRRLLVIRKRFPHRDEDDVPLQMYENLLELSRPGLYSKKLRKQALKLVMMQIATRQTGYLLRSLIRWPLKEIDKVISEFMRCLPTTGPKRDDEYESVARAYLRAAHELEQTPATPFLDFLLQLGQINRDQMELVFTLVPSCLNSKTLEQHHHPLIQLLQQRNSGMSPKAVSLLTMKYSTQLRSKAWKAVELECRERRLRQMSRKKDNFGSRDVELFDTCVDGIDFACGDGPLQDLAWTVITEIINLPDHSRAWKILADALALFHFTDQVRFLSTLMQYLQQDRPDLSSKDTSLRFTEFSIRAARLHTSIKTALVYSGCWAFYSTILDRGVNTRNDHHTVLGLESEQRMWDSIMDVLGEPPLDGSKREPPEPTPLTGISSAFIDVEFLDPTPDKEERFVVRITIPDPRSPREWTVRKRLSDLFDIDHRVRQGRQLLAARADGTSTNSRPSKIWEEYHLLDSDQKEAFVESFLSGLVRLPTGPCSQDVAAFFTSDIARSGSHDEFLHRREERRSHSQNGNPRNRVKDHTQSFLNMDDEEDSLDRILEVGFQWGLL
ncbi:Rho GTPase activating protein [Marasmius crinis-equi]|uniref:Rho GTPase activating protein n=1 Tax=Marasmius crinis-equi TaxID=585013 RepID=A0ABR3FZR8_9AGAR